MSKGNACCAGKEESSAAAKREQIGRWVALV
jgi:hypothetical protein